VARHHVVRRALDAFVRKELVSHPFHLESAEGFNGRWKNSTNHQNIIIHHWLVVLTVLKNISQWEGLSHILWKIKNVWNHQPDHEEPEASPLIHRFFSADREKFQDRVFKVLTTRWFEGKTTSGRTNHRFRVDFCFGKPWLVNYGS